MTAKTRQAAAAKTLHIDGGAPLRTTPMPPRRAIGEAERKRVEDCSQAPNSVRWTFSRSA